MNRRAFVFQYLAAAASAVTVGWLGAKADSRYNGDTIVLSPPELTAPKGLEVAPRGCVVQPDLGWPKLHDAHFYIDGQYVGRITHWHLLR